LQIFLNAIFLPTDNFNQASKQKNEW